ncbi:MAG TPA: enoyl-CoA hydratase [Ktedonobacteraceae bacterium]|nr:enoyl-CoA hydratase [Ktedonobacteraceae bacterium]
MSTHSNGADGDRNKIRDEGQREEGAVLLEQSGPVATLTLARPAALNALSWAMYGQLQEHLERLAADESLRVLIVRGAGKAFAAGTDIQQFRGFNGEDGIAYERRMEEVLSGLYNFPWPTIAAVHGYAVGAGLVIATACDLRYASPAARFGAPIARTLGNCLSLQNYRRVARAIGAMRAREMLFTGRLLTAGEALQSGFLTAIYEEEQLFPRVLEVAQQISANAPITLWAAKEADRRIAAVEAEMDIPYDDVVSRVYGSQDFREGVAAYLEKRKPEWTGR